MKNKEDIKTGLETRTSFDRIAHTAWGPAYNRAQAGIKYAPEIFDAIDAVVKPTDPLEKEYLNTRKESGIGPRFEARYILTNRLLAQNKTSQILEIASGLSPRGQIMTEEDPSLTYVEVDLPTMTENKRKILKKLFTEGVAKPQKNLHIEDGNSLDFESLTSAIKYFKNAPISIINEGLLSYFNFDQKAIMAKNIRSLLEKFGGVWITPDINLVKKQTITSHQKLVKELSGINIQDNEFADEESAIKFFEDAGFIVERHTLLEVADELVSIKKLGLSKKDTEEILNRPVFLMRLKK